ncbi:hypothetical protein TNCV_216031 [Trichonephila clavipes]|nr:hypothetical protein TNCV_216031 [Trichonephila clavipes]
MLWFYQLVKDKCLTHRLSLKFLQSTSCGMTGARGHGAIVYCLNSGSGVCRRVGIIDLRVRRPIDLLSKSEGFVEKNSAASWVTVLHLWKWYFCRSLTKNYAACCMPFGICMTKKVRFKIEYTSYGCNLTAQVLRMLEQFVVSRIVDIDILMQIWKNRVKQINVVLEWVRWVGSEIIPAEDKLEP